MGTAGRGVVVTGVLVVHDGAAWLPECLDALALQTRPLDRLVIVDTGSTDDGRQIAATHGRVHHVISEVQTISAPRESTFGSAVGQAVERLSVGSVSAQAPTRAEWLWLLHDDSAAAPQALSHLLDAARRSPSVGVAGPKLTTWDDPSRLLEVGSAVTRSGRRMGGPAAGDPDQGQHDHRSDVLAVSTSGMLIRRDVFHKLRGFDPAFGQFHADLDLCWRAHLAGDRVVVAPKARMREAAASANGQRFPLVSPVAARRRDRSHGRQVALARCSLYAVPVLALWIAVASLGSAVLLLVAKRPRAASAALVDLGSLLTPWRPLAARWRSRGIRRVRRRDLRGLFVSPKAGIAHTFDTIRDAVAFGPSLSGDDGVDSARSQETGPVADDADEFAGPKRGVAPRILRHPGFLAVMVSLTLAAATWRSLLGDLVPGSGLGFAGGELLPMSSDASGLWHAWLDGWHGAGLGNALESPPHLPALAAGAWVLEQLPFIAISKSSVGVLIAWLLAGAIPASTWTAYLAARVVTRAAWPRVWAALAWGSLATLTTAAAGGRVGAVVAHILLPLVAAGFVCAATGSARSWATFGAAAALGLTGAFNPLLGAVGAFAALVLLVLARGRTRFRAAVLLLVPIGLLGPWVLRLVEDPLLLLTGPGLTVWQGASVAPWQLALLHPGGPGPYPGWLSAPIVLAGLVAMCRREMSSPLMTVLAALAVTGLALGLAAPLVIVGLVPPGLAGAGTPITGWAGTGLDLAALALIAAALRGYCLLRVERGRLTGRRWPRGFGWRRVLVAPVVATAVLGVAASMAMTGWLGLGRILTGKAPSTPAVAADQAAGPSGSRLLVMTRDADAIDYQLVASEPGRVVRDLPAAEISPDALLAAAVKIMVSESASTSATAAHDALANLGVGFVGFRGGPTEPLVTRLDGTAGLTKLSDAQGLTLWRVLPRENAVSSSRLRLVDDEGDPLASIPVTGDHARTNVGVGPSTTGAAENGRWLVAAEPPGWAGHASVTFAGREVAAVGGREQPTYLLTAGAGQLSITLAPTHQWWRWGQLGLLLIVLFLAVPSGPERSRTTS